MSVLIQDEYVFPKEDVNELTMISACSHLFPSPQYYKFPNFYYRYEYEADLFVFSKARYASEIEVKISLFDWKADLKKKKHADLKYIKHFYYAVPTDLIDKIPDGIDVRYGLIEVYQGNQDSILRARFIKRADNLGATKIPKNIIIKAFRSMYWRNFKLQSNFRHIMNELSQLRKEMAGK